MRKLCIILAILMLLLCACQVQGEPEAPASAGQTESVQTGESGEPAPSSVADQTDEREESTTHSATDRTDEGEENPALLRELGFEFQFLESWDGHVTISREGQIVTVSLDGEAVFRVAGTPGAPEVYQTIRLWEQEGYTFFGETPDHVVYYQVLAEIPEAFATGYGSPYPNYTRTMNDIFHVVRMERETEEWSACRDGMLFLWVLPKTNVLRIHRLGVELCLTDEWRDGAAFCVSDTQIAFRPREVVEDHLLVETIPLAVLVLKVEQEQGYDLSNAVLLGSTAAGSCYVCDRTGLLPLDKMNNYPFMQSTAELIASGGVTLIVED